MCVTNTTNRRPQALALAAKLVAATPSASRELVNTVNQSSTVVASPAAAPSAPPSTRLNFPYRAPQYTVVHHAPPTASAGPASRSIHTPHSALTSHSVSSTSYGEGEPERRPKRRRKPQKPGKTAKMNDRHFVVHNYHDHALEEPDENDTPPASRRRGGVAIAFPLKLHAMLDQIEEDGLANVISWQPHGRAFVVHKPKEFVDHVMPKYFKQTKLTSFQRQLNLYGFCRLTRGRDNRGYYHELFLRGKPFLCKRMVRTKVKGTGFKAASSPDQEPDFYQMPYVVLASSPPSTNEGGEESSLGSAEDSLVSEPAVKVDDGGTGRHSPTPISQLSPVEPTSIGQLDPAGPTSVDQLDSLGPAPASETFPVGDPVLDEVVQELFLDDGAKDDAIRDFVEAWNVYDKQQPPPPGFAEMEVEDDLKLGHILEKFLVD